MAAFPALNLLSSTGGGLAGRGPKLGAPKPPSSPKPAGARTTAQGLRGVGTAGRALLGAANYLTAPHVQAPANPTGGGAAGGGAAAPQPQPSGLDATYFGNVAANQFRVGQQINADTLRQAQDRTALQNALAQLAYQQPRAELALEQKANLGGSLYSSVYNQHLGDLVNQFAQRQSADTTRYQGDIDRLALAISGLQGSVPVYDAQQALASTQRAAAAAQANPALGGIAPSSSPSAPPAGGAGAQGQSLRNAGQSSNNPTFAQLNPGQQALAEAVARAENARSNAAQKRARQELGRRGRR